MKVKDINGTILEGIERGVNNSLIVTDKTAYHKYIKEKERALKLKTLEDEVSEIKNTMAEILKLLKNNRVG